MLNHWLVFSAAYFCIVCVHILHLTKRTNKGIRMSGQLALTSETSLVHYFFTWTSKTSLTPSSHLQPTSRASGLKVQEVPTLTSTDDVTQLKLI